MTTMEIEEFKFEPVNNITIDPNSQIVASSEQNNQENDNSASSQIFRVFLTNNNENIHVVMKVSYHLPSQTVNPQFYSPNSNFSSNSIPLLCTRQCDMIKKEWDILAKVLPHPNIIQAYNVFQNVRNFTKSHSTSTGCCAMQMEEAQMDLYDYVVKLYLPNKGNRVAKLIDLFRQVALGLEHIHSQGFAHNDIKGENILVLGKTLDKAKVADFGLSTSIDEFHKSSPKERLKRQITQWKQRNLSHAAPEILDTLERQEEAFDERQSDVFAFGVSLFESIFGMRPFHKNSHKSDLVFKNFTKKKQFYHFWRQNNQIKQVLQQINKGSVNIDLLADFIYRCLQPSPKLRLSSQELVTHDLFD